MNVINRNFFRLLRSGALNEYEALEPMSAFKWERLYTLVMAQQVQTAAGRGMRHHQYDNLMNIPREIVERTVAAAAEPHTQEVALSNSILNKRLKRIEYEERHAIDTNVAALEVLRIIVGTVSDMLNRGMMLGGTLRLGAFMRTRGHEVDFVKLENWLDHLQLRRMAQLQGSILISVFDFNQDELPFVQHVEPAAYRLALRSVEHAASDTAEEWHFRQGRAGFLTNNSSLLRRNLRRSWSYITYCPIETVSNFFNAFTRSLQEIEE